MYKFDKNFIFGTATSSYQIEGAVREGGRTDSIWDVFSRKEGTIHNGDNGDIACDHYNLYEEDIELMKELGVESYRFSIAWPRIFPEMGKFNEEGMAFYKRIIAKLKEVDIRPAVTIYHWDMPQWLEDIGGWTNRESVKHFAEFSKACYENLGDDVDLWITHNEPFCAGILGYMIGVHAPGIKDVDASLKAIHHLLLSHGESVRLFRSMNLDSRIGITLNHSPAVPASESVVDGLAANNYDGWMNRWFLDPVFKGKYPNDMLNLYKPEVKSFDFIKPGDMEIISEPIDFFGINYYHASKVEYCENEPLGFKLADMGVLETAMGWPVTPYGLDVLITRIREEYTKLPIFITENGAAFDDVVLSDGSIQDEERTDYITEHLRTVSIMNQKGLGIEGYYLWSFLDNFEWAYGYEKRFGIVHVDFDTLSRTPKKSFYRYNNIIKDRAVPTL